MFTRKVLLTLVLFSVLASACSGIFPAKATEAPIFVSTASQMPSPVALTATWTPAPATRIPLATSASMWTQVPCNAPAGFTRVNPGDNVNVYVNGKHDVTLGWTGRVLTLENFNMGFVDIYTIEETELYTFEVTLKYQDGRVFVQEFDLFICAGGPMYLSPELVKQMAPNG